MEGYSMQAQLRLQNRRGASAILLVLMIPVVVGMVALTVDIGRLALEREKLTNVCDACAKAGGIDLPTAASSDVNADLSRAEATAKEYATQNGINLASVQFASDAVRDGNGYALLVSAKEEVPMSFARIFGIDTRPVQAAAKVRREGAPINEETKFVPLAVDRQSFTFGLEADLALSPCAKQHFWRIAIPNTTNADFEAMLRDRDTNEIGFATVGVSGAREHELKGYCVSQTTSTGHSAPGRPTGEDVQTRGVPLVQ